MAELKGLSPRVQRDSGAALSSEISWTQLQNRLQPLVDGPPDQPPHTEDTGVSGTSKLETSTSTISAERTQGECQLSVGMSCEDGTSFADPAVEVGTQRRGRRPGRGRGGRRGGQARGGRRGGHGGRGRQRNSAPAQQSKKLVVGDGELVNLDMLGVLGLLDTDCAGPAASRTKELRQAKEEESPLPSVQAASSPSGHVEGLAVDGAICSDAGIQGSQEQKNGQGKRSKQVSSATGVECDSKEAVMSSRDGEGRNDECDDRNTEGDDRNAEGDGRNDEGDGRNAEGDGRNDEGDARNTEGDGRNDEGDARNTEGDGRNDEGDDRNTEGDGRNTEGDGRNTEGDGRNDKGDGRNDEGDGRNTEGDGRNDGDYRDDEGGGKNGEGDGRNDEGDGRNDEGDGRNDEGDGRNTEGDGRNDGDYRDDEGGGKNGEGDDRNEGDGKKDEVDINIGEEYGRNDEGDSRAGVEDGNKGGDGSKGEGGRNGEGDSRGKEAEGGKRGESTVLMADSVGVAQELPVGEQHEEMVVTLSATETPSLGGRDPLAVEMSEVGGGSSVSAEGMQGEMRCDPVSKPGKRKGRPPKDYPKRKKMEDSGKDMENGTTAHGGYVDQSGKDVTLDTCEEVGVAPAPSQMGKRRKTISKLQTSFLPDVPAPVQVSASWRVAVGYIPDWFDTAPPFPSASRQGTVCLEGVQGTDCQVQSTKTAQDNKGNTVTQPCLCPSLPLPSVRCFYQEFLTGTC